MIFAYQGIPGSYSESCIKINYPDCEKTISCRTFQDAFELAKKNSNVKALVPEQNQLIGSINIETLILKYRLNIFAEHFFKINHSLLAIPGTKLEDIKNVYSHTAALSQTNSFIRKNKFMENVMADTAGSASYVSKQQDKSKAAIASLDSAKIYGLEVNSFIPVYGFILIHCSNSHINCHSCLSPCGDIRNRRHFIYNRISKIL